MIGQMPSRLGYQPTMGTELSSLEERIANTDSGAITSIQAVYVPADDFTDPAAVHTFSHLSATVVLSRKRASEGLFPAIDPLQSNSKMATPGIVGERHYAIAQAVRRTLAEICRAQGHHRHARARAALPGRSPGGCPGAPPGALLTQPFATTEQFTGMPGRTVSRADALDGCERILRENSPTTPRARST